MSTSGSLSTTAESPCRRPHETAAWSANREASATAPWSSGGLRLSSVEAITAPDAMVMAKSRLDIFEKLRSPTSRTSPTSTA